MVDAVVIVPCYEEASRLDSVRFLELAKQPGVKLLFVNDGSKDRTAEVLEELRTRSPETISVLNLPMNVGKGEAVRRGMIQAMGEGAEVVGYADADLATPPNELVRLLGEFEARGADVVIGSRMMLLGRRIVRKPTRHILGRVFATAASNILQLAVYDTQCGAKFFRNTRALHAALSTPFISRWAFDVELLGRLTIGTEAVSAVSLDKLHEIPLDTWIDAPESKVTLAGMAKTLVDLGRIDADMRRRRKRVGRAP